MYLPNEGSLAVRQKPNRAATKTIKMQGKWCSEICAQHLRHSRTTKARSLLKKLQVVSAWPTKSLSLLGLLESAEVVVVLNAQFCRICTWAVKKFLLFILNKPVVFHAESKLIRNSLLLLPGQLDIQDVTGESESGEST